LAEVEISELNEGAQVNIPITLKAEIPDADPPGIAMKVSHTVKTRGGSTPVAMPPAILEAVKMLNLYRMNENIWQDIGNGKSEEVVKRMQQLTKRFEEAGLGQLANNVRQNTRMLQSGDALSDGDRMEIKYGTRLQLTTTLQSALEQEGQDSE